MKKLKLKIGTGFWLGVLIIPALLLPPKAGATDITSFRYYNFTNSVAGPNPNGPFNNASAVTLTNGQTLVVTSDAISLRQHQGMAFGAGFVGTNAVAGSTNVVFAFNLGVGNAVQGTNWTTTTPVVWSQNYNTNAFVFAGTNYPGAVLDNFAFIRLATISIPPGYTNTLTVSNVWAEYSNWVGNE
jgi:hypothetical protein